MFRKVALAALVVLLLGIPATFTAAVQLENRDAFCASCHTEPETSYYNRSLSEPTDLASAHAQENYAVRCIDCHSGEGLLGRTVSLRQGSTDLVAYLLDNYADPAVSTNPVGDTGCVKCHTPRGGLFTDLTIPSRSHYHRAAYLNEWKARAELPAGACAQCHPAHTQESKPTNQGCEACHRALSGWEPPE